MEKQVIVSLILLVAGLLGVGHFLAPAHLSFRATQSEDYYQEQFLNFQWKFEKVYNDEAEESKRFQLFKNALIMIEEHNKNNNDIKLGMNQFGDLTDKEFASTYLNRMSSNSKRVYAKSTPSNRPNKVDWVGTLVLNSVYDQGSCGSCWAHAATQALEGAYAKQNGKIRKLSIQELVDCVYPSQDTCETGGMEQEGMAWTIKNGICAEEDYPTRYTAKQGTCQKSKCKPVLTNIEQSIYIPKGQTQIFLNYLAVAPMAVAIDAGQYTFKYYQSGIIKGSTSTSLNHAVLAVGFDETGGFTKVKNSWGGNWGESGYFRVEIINGNGPLGIYSEPSFPIYKEEPVPKVF